MNPESSALKPVDDNSQVNPDDKSNEADNEPELSHSSPISPADTDELDLADYLRFRAQSRLNEARVRLLSNIQGTDRHNVLLMRMDPSSGGLSSPQPRGEERPLLTPQGILATRANMQRRQGLARNKDPTIALRRRHAVETWEENFGSRRKDWREARPVIENVLASFGYEDFVPELGYEMRRRVTRESQERRRRPAAAAAGKGRERYHPPSRDFRDSSLGPRSSPATPFLPTGAIIGSEREANSHAIPALSPSTQATLPPLPTPSQILPLIPPSGIHAQSLLDHFAPILIAPSSPTTTERRKVAFLAILQGILDLDLATKTVYRRHSEVSVEEVRRGGTVMDVRGLGRRVGRGREVVEGRTRMGRRRKRRGRVDEIGLP